MMRSVRLVPILRPPTIPVHQRAMPVTKLPVDRDKGDFVSCFSVHNNGIANGFITQKRFDNVWLSSILMDGTGISIPHQSLLFFQFFIMMSDS